VKKRLPDLPERESKLILEVAKKIGGLNAVVEDDMKTVNVHAKSGEHVCRGYISYASSRPENPTINYIKIYGSEKEKLVSFLEKSGYKDIARKLKKHDEVYFTLDEDQKKKIADKIMEVYKRFLKDLKSGKIRINVVTVGSDYVYEVISVDTNELTRRYGIYGWDLFYHVVEEIYHLRKSERWKGRAGEDVTEEVCRIIREIDEKTRKEFEEKLQAIENMTSLDVVRNRYVGKVHVDENGCFSNCEPWCDDCVWIEYVKTKDFPEVRQMCEGFTVKSRSGKVYFYYEANEKALKYIAKKLEKSGEIDKIKEEEKRNLIESYRDKWWLFVEPENGKNVKVTKKLSGGNSKKKNC